MRRRKYGHHARDAQHAEIASRLVQTGHSVVDLSQMGGGMPDLLIGRAGVMRLVEIKSDKAASKSKTALSKKQRIFRDQWKGTEILQVTDADQVIGAINADVRRMQR